VWHNKYPLFAGLQSQGIYALVHRQFAEYHQYNELGGIIYDATCPLVTKVHKEVMHKQKQNHQVILIGHEGHPEVEGTLGPAFDTPCALKITTLPVGTSSISSTKIAPLVLSLSTTNLLCTTS
jgi:4-hydroxy-3-methylbut-2-enyl diphosphate reductase IspH